MAKQVVTFNGPTHKIPLSDQQRIVDQIIDHLGIEVIQVKPGCYVIEDIPRARRASNAKLKDMKR